MVNCPICGYNDDDEIDRLRKIEDAARALKFALYPAHGSGFVVIVKEGNVNALRSALGWEGTEIIRPKLTDGA